MVDQQMVDRDILRPLAEINGPLTIESAFAHIHVANIQIVEDWQEIVHRIPCGFVVLFGGRRVESHPGRSRRV